MFLVSFLISLFFKLFFLNRISLQAPETFAQYCVYNLFSCRLNPYFPFTPNFLTVCVCVWLPGSPWKSGTGLKWMWRKRCQEVAVAIWETKATVAESLNSSTRAGQAYWQGKWQGMPHEFNLLDELVTERICHVFLQICSHMSSPPTSYPSSAYVPNLTGSTELEKVTYDRLYCKQHYLTMLRNTEQYVNSKEG